MCLIRRFGGENKMMTNKQQNSVKYLSKEESDKKTKTNRNEITKETKLKKKQKQIGSRDCKRVTLIEIR